MSSRTLLVVLLLALVSGGAYMVLGGTGDDEPAPTAPVAAADGDVDPADARSAEGPAADRDPDVTRTTSETGEPGTASTPDPSGGAVSDTRIAGRLIDQQSGTPIEGARVVAEHDLGRSGLDGLRLLRSSLSAGDSSPAPATSDADGRFMIPVPEAWLTDAPVRVRVDHVDYRLLRSPSTAIALDQTNEIGDLLLVQAPVLTVEVVDSTNSPIAGAEVRRFGSSGPIIELPSGVAEEDNSATGSFAISFSSSGDSGNGIELANLRDLLKSDQLVRPRSWITDEQGRCRIPCEPGDLGLRIRAERFATSEARVSMPERGQLTERVRLEDAALLRVFATDQNGDPLVGRKIEARTDLLGTVTEETDDDGVAQFDRLPIGLVRVRFPKKPRAGVFVIEGLGAEPSTADKAVEVELFPGRTAEARLVAESTLSTTLRITLDGMPLEGASVTSRRARRDGDGPALLELDGILSGRLGPKTDETGAIELHELELVPTTFTVRHEDLALAVRFDRDLATGPEEVSIALVSSRIRGRVLGPDGQPVAGATVRLLEMGGSGNIRIGGSFVLAVDESSDDSGQPSTTRFGGPATDTTTTEIDGSFAFRLVPPDRPLAIDVSAEAGRGRFPQEVRIESGQNFDAGTLTLTSTGSAEVRISDDALMSVVVAQRLDASGETTGDPMIQPAVEGTAAFDGMMPGRWQFRLGFGDGAVTTEHNIVAGRKATFDLGR